MLQVTKIWLEGGELGENARSRVIGTRTPLIGWTVESDKDEDAQTACRVAVCDGEKTLWDSGWQQQAAQRMTYAGDALQDGKALTVQVWIKNTVGEQAVSEKENFFVGLRENWEGSWIVPTEYRKRAVIEYRCIFELKPGFKAACLYLAGIGYHKAYLNGQAVDTAVMDPAHTNYAKTVQYAVLTGVEKLLKDGKNVLVVEVADGWRNIDSHFVDINLNHPDIKRAIEFNGRPMLNAVLAFKDAEGRECTVATDESWQWRYGPVVSANIFDGETYDANQADNAWLTAEATGFAPVRKDAGPGGKLIPMVIPPILEQEIYPAVDIFEPKKGTFVVDFGQNMAGVLKFTLPDKLKKGQTITVSFMEFLDEDGTIYRAPLREAKQTDTYIASGDERDLTVWQPRFTYHGFRYAEITGLDRIDKKQITAVALYTDIVSGSTFSCGNPLINKIHQNAVQTEKANIHSILTDCPQRDERMGWMNDATVRFEETPYNFAIGRMFAKVVRDIRNEQRENGAFTCCAPFVFGCLPADPVCSSYLVAGAQTLLFTGNLDLIGESFDGFAAWEDYLLSRSKDYIVQYSYYGDWASPAYACPDEENAVSAVTPGLLMSTGYSYFNCRTLARFAGLLGRKEDEKTYTDLAEKVKEAYLKEWWHADTAKVAEGSQASQAFTLWLGLLEKDDSVRAAAVLHEDLVKKNYKFTTGNLCTRYLMDILTRYGYLEDAWKILNSTEYPSYGFMIQNEATTVWERFELKKNGGMNSHNHPMYGAVDYWFYRYLCGIELTENGADAVRIAPAYPADLLSARAVVETVHGDISVRWVKRYGQLHLYVKIPFGVKGKVALPTGEVEVGSGCHTYHWDI